MAYVDLNPYSRQHGKDPRTSHQPVFNSALKASLSGEQPATLSFYALPSTRYAQRHCYNIKVICELVDWHRTLYSAEDKAGHIGSTPTANTATLWGLTMSNGFKP